MAYQYLYGFNPILAALSANRRKFFKLFMTEPIFENKKILDLAKEMQITTQVITKEKIEKFAYNKPHQGVILKASELEPNKITDPSSLYVTGNHSQLWVCLDQVTDPQNFGTVLRVAEFLKIEGVLIPSKNTAPLSATVAKVSSGAVDWMNICSVNDIPLFLSQAKLKEWKVIGTGKGAPISALHTFLKPSDNVIIIFGSEGQGIRPRILKECQEQFWIEGHSEAIDSLNIATASAIFLHNLKTYLNNS
ncbi:unnamed protein product [Blepharisma stoltei]|uniref:rRNA methyltransferase 1, mitochondrial n=1 Tax=Blepharisma stoltei TaxID=1481888 RepID=A0AAU9J8J9_9CILI|nr:unnamed protein product [Blepharisma stoltei]